MDLQGPADRLDEFVVPHFLRIVTENHAARERPDLGPEGVTQALDAFFDFQGGVSGIPNAMDSYPQATRDGMTDLNEFFATALHARASIPILPGKSNLGCEHEQGSGEAGSFLGR
jgi:hypothetical protein